MAENKSNSGGSGSAGIFARRVQKQLSRAQEKVLQKLGKTVETKDEQFEQCSQNLNKQQSDGNRIFKDIKAYYSAVKAMRETSKRLSQSLRDVYEEDWQGGEDLAVITESEDLLWNDYEEKLADQAVRTMENYISQFPEAKERVAKRGRKLVDYDSSRHHLEALQNAKKKDEMKIAKADEEFHKAQTVFEDINRELREELPVLYQSRIGCYVTVFQNLSNLRDVFYREMSTLNNNLYNVMKKLETQHSDKAFIIKGWESSSAATGTKKRRSVMISAPIPCNTAFPSDHVSNRESIQKQKGEDQEKAADEKAAGFASSSSGDTSEPEEAEVDSNSSSDSPAVESDEETVCAAREEQKQDTTKEDQEKDGKGTEPEADQSEVNTSEERLTQTSEQEGSHEDSSALPSSELEDLPVGSENDRPKPAPRRAAEKRTSLKLLDANGVEAEPACTNENPPGFLYKAVALESHASAEEGELQFEEGDVILVIAFGEELPEGKARGVKENDWIQHRDELNHTGFIMENHIQRVDAK